MARWIPIEILEDAGYPAIVADEDGRVEYWNSMAADLLGLDHSDTEGRRCWELMRFKSPDGKRLCQARCTVQKHARAGRLQRHKAVLVKVNGDPAMDFDLVSVAVSPPRGRRCAILHLLRPMPETTAAETTGAVSPKKPSPLELLTPREWLVLEHLAEGMGTDAIAEALFVCRATVRNHVSAILSKLGVHSRIEAILLKAAADATRRPPSRFKTQE